jgi:hypothetical protein
VLAQILETSGFHDQFVDLSYNIQLVIRFELSAIKLLVDTIKDLESTSILSLGFTRTLSIAIQKA